MKIMVVDDQPEILAEIKGMLETLGAHALTVADSREAAKLLQSQSFDSVFVDVQMPHLDGFELTRLIRTSQRNTKTPIVMLTDQDDIQTRRLAFKAGATYFLGKPVTMDRMQGLYNAVLGPMLSQRRKSARVPYVATVNCARGLSGGKDFVAQSVDLSVGGMSLECSTNPEVGTSLSIEFFLTSGGTPIRLHSKVVRLIPPHRFGVQFIGLAGATLEVIRNFIAPPLGISPPKTSVGGKGRSGNGLLSKDAALHQRIFAEMEAPKIQLTTAPPGSARSPAKSAASIAGMLTVICLTYWMVNRFSTPATSASITAGQNRKPAAPAQSLQSADDEVESPSLSLSPAVILAAYHPGQTISQTLTINNQSGQELTFVMSAEDMSVQDGRLVPAERALNGIASGVSFASPRITAKPWRSSTMKFSLTIPSDSPDHAVLIVLNGTDKIPAMNGVTLQATLGTLISFVEPQSVGQKTAAGASSQGALMNYSVSQWLAR